MLETKTKNVLKNCSWIRILGAYSPTILKNIRFLVLQICLYVEAFESNTTYDWLNRLDQQIISCVIFSLKNHEDKDYSKEWLVNTDPCPEFRGSKTETCPPLLPPSIFDLFQINIFMPKHRKVRGILFYSCPSVCLDKLHVKT